jgi:hypothetical protein
MKASLKRLLCQECSNPRCEVTREGQGTRMSAFDFRLSLGFAGLCQVVSRLMLAAASAGRHKVFAVNYLQEKFCPLQQYVPIVHLYKADRVKEHPFFTVFLQHFPCDG